MNCAMDSGMFQVLDHRKRRTHSRLLAQSWNALSGSNLHPHFTAYIWSWLVNVYWARLPCIVPDIWYTSSCKPASSFTRIQWNLSNSLVPEKYWVHAIWCWSRLYSKPPPPLIRRRWFPKTQASPDPKWHLSSGSKIFYTHDMAKSVRIWSFLPFCF